MVSRLTSSASVAPAKSLLELGDERCPLCRQRLPHDLNARELQARLDENRSEAARTEGVRLRAEFEEKQTLALEALKKQMATQQLEREKTIRAEAKGQAEAEIKNQLKAAQAATTKAEQQLNQVRTQQDERVKVETDKALRKQREVLDKDKTTALQQAEAQGFRKYQKLQRQLEAAKRELEKKSAAELGEGAEIELYETLRGNFSGDRIKRVKRGEPGADIRHEVIHRGEVCGSILYDSKNHKAWRSDFVEKLKNDQLADKADHAILTTSAFPAGRHQLCVQNDVIVLNPARVVELVGILRTQILQAHRLRLGAEERVRKTEKLYEFINSDRCRQLLERHDTLTGSLLDLEKEETETHRRTWQTRGKLIRDVQKAHGDFRAEVDRIIEGADPA